MPQNTAQAMAETISENNIEEENPVSFDKFGFEKAILRSIKKEGYTIPTPIQDMAILPLLGGADLMGIAQTGSGKTAAFSLPTMNKLIHDYYQPTSKKPKVLILAPTRELVMQIGKFIDTFSRGTPIKSLVVAGGQPYQPQIRKLKNGVDILISTPGRLIDHMNSGAVMLNECHTFILDEADRMLDMGFIDDVKEVREKLEQDHQTVMFSATMNDKVRKLSLELLTNPEYIEQERKTVVADTIAHKLMNVRRSNKAELLVELLQDETIDKALVFARTKLGADDLCDHLKEAFHDSPVRVDAIHGDKKQRTREKILLNFRKGRTKVLVATDVAARGIDVDGITHVINYELPIEAENYVHRVGRTGRAGERGIAISFCDPSDIRLLKEIEKLIKIPIEVDENHPFHFDVSEIKELKKGRKGRTRNKRGADNGNKNRTGERLKSRRPAKKWDPVDQEKEPKEFNKKTGKPREFKGKQVNRTEQNRPAKTETAKKESKRYDPWRDSKVFDDDPVLQKLRAKPASKKKKSPGSAEIKPKKKAVNSEKRRVVKGPKKVVQSGGNKAFSPRRSATKSRRG